MVQLAGVTWSVRAHSSSISSYKVHRSSTNLLTHIFHSFPFGNTWSFGYHLPALHFSFFILIFLQLSLWVIAVISLSSSLVLPPDVLEQLIHSFSCFIFGLFALCPRLAPRRFLSCGWCWVDAPVSVFLWLILIVRWSSSRYCFLARIFHLFVSSCSFWKIIFPSNSHWFIGCLRLLPLVIAIHMILLALLLFELFFALTIQVFASLFALFMRLFPFPSLQQTFAVLRYD